MDSTMRLTNKVVKPYIGGTLNVIEAVAEVKYWLRGTITGARVTGRKKEERRLRLTVEPLEGLCDLDEWCDLYPRSFVIPIDEFDANELDGRLTLDAEDCEALILVRPEAPPVNVFWFIISDPEEKRSTLYRLACTADRADGTDEINALAEDLRMEAVRVS
jgi:hypothetical protein